MNENFTSITQTAPGLVEDITATQELVFKADLPLFRKEIRKLITQETGIPSELAQPDQPETSAENKTPIQISKEQLAAAAKTLEQAKRQAEVERKQAGRRQKFEAAMEKANYRQFSAYLETHFKGVDFSSPDDQVRLNVARAIFQNGKNATTAHDILSNRIITEAPKNN